MQYVDAFDRRNLNAVGKIRRGSMVVLLGDQVRKAFGVPKLLIHPQTIDGVTYRQVPHPSGRNRFYNDPVQHELVALLIEELYRG